MSVIAGLTLHDVNLRHFLPVQRHPDSSEIIQLSNSHGFTINAVLIISHQSSQAAL